LVLNKGLSEIAKELKLTRERIRQLRNSAFIKLGLDLEEDRKRDEYVLAIKKVVFKSQRAKKRLKRRRIYYKENQEIIRQRVREWQKENPEQFKASQKKHRENHPKKIKASHKKYYLKNKKRLKAVSKKWREENKKKGEKSAGHKEEVS